MRVDIEGRKQRLAVRLQWEFLQIELRRFRRFAKASSMVSPWVVVPVSGFIAVNPPSRAGTSTAVSCMDLPELRFRTTRQRGYHEHDGGAGELLLWIGAGQMTATTGRRPSCELRATRPVEQIDVRDPGADSGPTSSRERRQCRIHDRWLRGAGRLVSRPRRVRRRVGSVCERRTRGRVPRRG